MKKKEKAGQKEENENETRRDSEGRPDNTKDLSSSSSSVRANRQSSLACVRTYKSRPGRLHRSSSDCVKRQTNSREEEKDVAPQDPLADEEKEKKEKEKKKKANG